MASTFFNKRCNVCNRPFQTFFDDERVTTFTLDTIQGEVHYVYKKNQWVSWICENMNFREEIGDVKDENNVTVCDDTSVVLKSDNAKNNNGNDTNANYFDKIVEFKEGSDEDTENEGHFYVESTEDKNYENDVVESSDAKDMGAERLNVVSNYSEIQELIPKDYEANNSLNNSLVGFVSGHVTRVRCSKTSEVKESLIKDEYSDEKKKLVIVDKNKNVQYCKIRSSSIEDDASYENDLEVVNVLTDIKYDRFENNIDDSEDVGGNNFDYETLNKYPENVNNYYKYGINSNNCLSEEKELQSNDPLLQEGQEIKIHTKRRISINKPMTVSDFKTYLAQQREKKKRWFFQGLP
ncbi:hypothetical protein JTE90_004367 [Oedothorax gibbosus]|uniref:Uncharacterized protein n=1 Tax=Oedothorax gibbosus TaxID=931172 RepID=A0AAV6VKE4_9ARAC|nr:hypothetical protein JTE90_004367 [Oedothorax gibbosus]